MTLPADTDASFRRAVEIFAHHLEEYIAFGFGFVNGYDWRLGDAAATLIRSVIHAETRRGVSGQARRYTSEAGALGEERIARDAAVWGQRDFPAITPLCWKSNENRLMTRYRGVRRRSDHRRSE